MKHGQAGEHVDECAIVGVSATVMNGVWDWPLHGLRHRPVGQTTGWYLWTGELSDDDDFFRPWHQHHLLERAPSLARLLEYPPGTRFLVAPGHEDVWTDASLLEAD